MKSFFGYIDVDIDDYDYVLFVIELDYAIRRYTPFKGATS